MWTIVETKDAVKALLGLPPQVRKKYEHWKSIVHTTGPEALAALPGFHDEALRYEWAGHRSSRLNRQWRVIYRVDHDEILVSVERITPHDYRR